MTRRTLSWIDRLESADLLRLRGRVTRSLGALVEASGPPSFVGETCKIAFDRSSDPALAEVVGFAHGRVLLMPWNTSHGIRPGAEVVGTGRALSIPVGEGLLGRVVDGLGRPIDGGASLSSLPRRAARGERLSPLARQMSTEPLPTGVRAIDGFLTCARGQRLGVFAGGGVGKSVLLGMLARNTAADVNVIALIGERGREVRNFLEKELGQDGRSRSVIVTATSDESAVQRVQAARTASTIAESFRDAGKHVLLVMDSLTRVAMAQREIGLAAGEPPTTRGYPPSAFSLLPELVERAGATDTGSITGFYSVLLEGDDLDAPISDAARAVLDGHVVLSRRLAERGHFPAIDVLDSISRLRDEVVDEEMIAACRDLVGVLSARREADDLLSIGAYKPGSDPQVEAALAIEADLAAFLRQRREESSEFGATRESLMNLVAKTKEATRVSAA